MPVVEIDETELQNYRRVSEFVNRALADNNARKLVLQAQKTLNPNAVIPELDAAEPVKKELDTVRDEVKSVREELAAEKAAREERARLEALRTSWDQGRAKLREQGYTTEAIEKIEKIMEEKGVADHEIAAHHFDRLYPTPEPVAAPGGRVNLFNDVLSGASADETMKLLYDGKEDAFLARSINETLGRRVL